MKAKRLNISTVGKTTRELVSVTGTNSPKKKKITNGEAAHSSLKWSNFVVDMIGNQSSGLIYYRR